MTYILKKGIESFRVVDGPFAGRKFVRDQQYAEIPPQEKKKFEAVKEPALEAKKPAAAGKKAEIVNS